MDLPMGELLLQQIDTIPEPKNDPFSILEWKEINERHFWISNDITWDDCCFIVRMIQLINRIDNTINPEPIHIHIMSNGGELPTMFAIYDAIKASRVPVYTYNEGAAHSAAFIIFLAGHKRFARKHAVSIAHEGSAAMAGSYRESKAAMKAYEKDVANMRHIISEETNFSEEEVNLKFEENQDWYIFYEDMIQYGIIEE